MKDLERCFGSRQQTLLVIRMGLITNLWPVHRVLGSDDFTSDRGWRKDKHSPSVEDSLESTRRRSGAGRWRTPILGGGRKPNLQPWNVQQF